MCRILEESKGKALMLKQDRLRRWAAFWLALWLCVPSFAPAEAKETYYTVDLEMVQQSAPDAVAWLYQQGTDLNLPLVYSESPYYYLSHRYDGRSAKNGTIYMTGDERPDFSAPVIVLKGSNCLDYSLFGSLSEYKDEAFYHERSALTLITPEGNYRLEIFAGIRTRNSDRRSWMVPEDDAQRMQALQDILDNSYIRADESLLPEQGDAWAILTTESAEDGGSRFVVYARKRPIEQGNARVVDLVKAEMDERETKNGFFTVDGVGTWMVYGQNDPVWNRLIFETANSSRRRPFGDGGCGPTAVASAIANLVPREELGKIANFSASMYGFRFCPCSVTENYCSGLHQRYVISTPEEYLRYFPLVVGSFATGNNLLGVQGRRDSWGTNMSYLETLCGLYDLSVTTINDQQEAVEFLRQKRGMAVTCTVRTSPFTGSSHFLTLAGADEEYLYVLDPLRRENYGELDPYSWLEILTPGLVRVKLDKIAQIPMHPIYLLERK